MAAKYTGPGVYLEEISGVPPSVAEVETAIPAFIGYTEIADEKGEVSVLHLQPKKINSLLEYETNFGKAPNEKNIKAIIKDKIDTTGSTLLNRVLHISIGATQPFLMHYAIRMYFENGGGPCYIASVGDYSSTEIDLTALTNGLNSIGTIDETTLFVFPDAINMASETNYYALINRALMQAKDLINRFAIVDMYNDDPESLRTSTTLGNGTDLLKYGAAYHPYLKTIYNHAFNETDIVIEHATVDVDGTLGRGNFDTLSLEVLGDSATAATYDLSTYKQIKLELNKKTVTLAPSCAIAGIYVAVDKHRGVWKAPANVSIASCIAPTINITNEDQADLNVHSSGKSINAIRVFPNRGILVWGARTMAGNDNEWRYISVRRFFNMVEESVRKSTELFVFEPNDANTWASLKTMVENYLLLKWRDGALTGPKPEDAYFVRIGLGQTMTNQDIINKLMNFEIGMATIRPAEFTIIKFSHQMKQ